MEEHDQNILNFKILYLFNSYIRAPNLSLNTKVDIVHFIYIVERKKK